VVLGAELAAIVALGAWSRWERQPVEPAWSFRRHAAPFTGPTAPGRSVEGRVHGLLMFRGNPSRTFYGEGPVPSHPRVLWRYPQGRPMCAISVVGREAARWCGSGWTGQPVVVEREDGEEVIVGTYDRAIHFLDAATGRERRPAFPTGDIIKGSVTLDPDGYPLLYSGSRDNFFHVIALDRDPPRELWRLSAADAPRPRWNDDWDGNGVVLGDYLFEGGENSWFYVVKLNRGYDPQGRVQVAPRVLVRFPSFDDSLLAALHDDEVSIENSPAVFGYRAYFANSGGAVWGLDLSDLRRDSSSVRPVFRYWTGDDTDASIVVDETGNLYVASEQQRFNDRGRAVGQLVKLDPRRAGDPRVWGLSIPPGRGERQGGVWATPALFGNLLFVPTNSGRLLAVDRDSGLVRWELRLAPHAWSSPVVVDSTLIVADCEGIIRALDLRGSDEPPPLLWQLQLRGAPCIESTPAVWHGRMFVGARDGYIYAIGDR
jgi:outer membrane protein assembly factor BamB